MEQYKLQKKMTRVVALGCLIPLGIFAAVIIFLGVGSIIAVING